MEQRIFLLPARRFLEELERLEPKVLQACVQAVDKAATDLDFLRLDPTSFQSAPNISIDYAVMEKTPHAAVVPVDCAWSDIGAWSALWSLASKDQNGTAALGDVVALDSKDCYIRSDGPLVATVGIEDLVIVATQDAILVAPKDRDQDVKKLVDELKARGHDSAVQTLRVHRPWGFYQCLHAGERFQVKRITVSPGEKLSLQMHYHRAEHWIVVNGTAMVTRDNERDSSARERIRSICRSAACTDSKIRVACHSTSSRCNPGPISAKTTSCGLRISTPETATMASNAG